MIKMSADITERDLLIIRECYAYGMSLGESNLTSEQAKDEMTPFIQSISQNTFECCIAIAAGRMGFDRAERSEPLTNALVETIHNLGYLFGLSLLLEKENGNEFDDDSE